MIRHSFSPIRILSVFAIIGVAVLIYFMLHPKLAITPVQSSDLSAAFGTSFQLRNNSISVLYELSSSYCVNALISPDKSAAAAGNLRFGVPNQSVALPDLPRHDAEALPIDDVFSGPPGSQVDLVFVIRFRPGWWIDLIEKRFRFVGTENQDKTWIWNEMPLDSPCG